MAPLRPGSVPKQRIAKDGTTNTESMGPLHLLSQAASALLGNTFALQGFNWRSSQPQKWRLKTSETIHALRREAIVQVNLVLGTDTVVRQST